MALTKDTIVIYHGGCTDGFGAAWVLWTMFGDKADYYAGVYGKSPPKVRGKKVYIVDFSYSYDVMKSIIERAEAVVVLDHHRTSKRVLTKLNGLGADLQFDIERSGAMMAWDYMYPGKDAPDLIHHIQDRDLWQFKIPHTREIIECLRSYPWDFEKWDSFMMNPCAFMHMREEGTVICRVIDKHVASMTRKVMVAHVEDVDGRSFRVPVVNAPGFYASETGAKMNEEYDIAMTYFDTPSGRTFSLRCKLPDYDMSKIAENYGGGGSKGAAGFTVSKDHRFCRL